MNIFKKGLIAAVATGFVAAAAAGTPAFAQQEAAGLNLSEIQQLVQDKATTDLVIHKHETPRGQAGNGLEQQVTSPGIGGAEFRVYHVPNIDLTTQAGWEAAQKMTPGDYNPADADVFTTVTTGANGQATVSNLPVGLYYVVESKAAEGYAADAQPFFVALPMTHPTQLNTRLETVHVYPKNTREGLTTKTVDDANKNVGDTVNYTISTERPGSTGDKVVKLAIGDKYDADRLTFAGNDTVTVTDEAGQTYTQGADYTIADNGAGLTVITLTDAGLAKASTLSTGQKVMAKLGYTVTAIEGDNLTSVDNRYDVRSQVEGQAEPGNPGDPKDPDPNEPGTPDEPEDPPATRTFLGNVDLIKKGPDGGLLEGATFDLYRCNSIDDIQAQPIGTGYTTGANGVVRLPSLHVNDFVDNEYKASDPTGYCVIETKAPAGHELLADPVYFQVLRDANETPEVVELTRLELTNVEDNAGFGLPLTGGEGVYWLLAGGAMLLLIGGSFYYLQRRKA